MRAARLGRELDMLMRAPPPGIAVWPSDDNKDGGARLDRLEVSLQGPPDCPYEEGRFRLAVSVPARYPMEPPMLRFLTKVFHPNIDGQGRICLDSLKMPPAGAWQPSLNIAQVLSQIRLLLQEPNTDDPLMPEISDLLRSDRNSFEREARRQTELHAVDLSAMKRAREDGGTQGKTAKQARRKL